MIGKLKILWKDPVGSKIISAGIIALIAILYSTVKSIVTNDSFTDILKSLFNHRISILNLILILFGILILWIVWISIKKSKKPKSIKYNESHKVLDLELFDRIKTQLLPPDGAVGFIRTNNFAGFAFRVEFLDDLYKFENEFSKPDFEFIDQEMENTLKELKNHTSKFTSFIRLNTWSTSNKNINANTVPPEWEFEQPERFWDIVNNIHSEAREICAKYDKLIKTGRRILTE